MKLDREKLNENTYAEMENAYTFFCQQYDHECTGCPLTNINYCALAFGYIYAKETQADLT